MSEKAQGKGVQIWGSSRVVGIQESRKGFSVEIQRHGKKCKVDTSFLVGADGARSTVRSLLFHLQSARRCSVTKIFEVIE